MVHKQRLYNLSSSNKTSVYKVVDFPLTSYPYLKVVFNNSGSLPVNLLKVGTATTTLVASSLDEISSKKISISEKNKTTQIQINFENPEIIHEFSFKISEPEFYNRKATVSILKTRTVKKKNRNV